jgi:hypothetical protein
MSFDSVFYADSNGAIRLSIASLEVEISKVSRSLSGLQRCDALKNFRWGHWNVHWNFFRPLNPL